MNTHEQPFVILLVEDEEGDAGLIKWALGKTQLPVDFHHVFDGQQAFEFLEQRPSSYANAPRPDLILLDLNMPCMGGLQFLALVKKAQSLSNIPVVILSTSHAESDVRASLELGASDYFAKPMDINQLEETIRVLVERWIIPKLNPDSVVK